jgi:hypothetical protein
MNDLPHVLQEMPPDGLRLPNGLALRLTTGNGMAVLGCSRVDVAPSDKEMASVQEAVWQTFKPVILLQADKNEYRLSGGYEHAIRRLYWLLEAVSVVRTRPVQQALFAHKKEVMSID